MLLIEGNRRHSRQKNVITFSIPVLLTSSIASYILCAVFLCQAGRITLMAFRKGVFLLITTFCIIYLFLDVSIFLPACLNTKTTLQTVENHLPDRASIFDQLTFFTIHWIYFTFQRLMGKCQCRALTNNLTSFLIIQKLILFQSWTYFANGGHVQVIKSYELTELSPFFAVY